MPRRIIVIVFPVRRFGPLLTAIGFSIGLIWAVFQFSGYYPAIVLGGIGLIGWFWPRRSAEAEP